MKNAYAQIYGQCDELYQCGYNLERELTHMRSERENLLKELDQVEAKKKELGPKLEELNGKLSKQLELSS